MLKMWRLGRLWGAVSVCDEVYMTDEQYLSPWPYLCTKREMGLVSKGTRTGNYVHT